MKTIYVLLAVMMMSACSHRYTYKNPEGRTTTADVKISQSIMVKNTYNTDGHAIFMAMEESGYFPSLYQPDEAKKTDLIFVPKFDKESDMNILQALIAIPSILTLGLFPSYISEEMTLNIAVYRGDVFLNRYRMKANTYFSMALWNVTKVDRHTLAAGLMHDFVRQLKADLDKK